MEQENRYPIELLTEEQKPVYEEWKRIFDLAHNPPPLDIEIGTVVMPTGDYKDRIDASEQLFVARYIYQRLKPSLVVTGKWSHPDLPDGGMGANNVVQLLKQSGGIPDDMKERVISEPDSTNTKQQAENVYDLLIQQVIQEPLVAVVSTYHLPRFCSTLVSTILAHEETPRTRLYSVAVDLPWTEEIPMENRGERYLQVFIEMTRITNYRPSGDVATEEQLTYYVNWLKNQ